MKTRIERGSIDEPSYFNRVIRTRTRIIIFVALCALLVILSVPMTARVSLRAKLQIEAFKTEALYRIAQTSPRADSIALRKLAEAEFHLSPTQIMFRDPESHLFYDWILIRPDNEPGNVFFAAPRPMMVDGRLRRLIGVRGTAEFMDEERFPIKEGASTVRPK
jgi:hypothetical protein